MLYKCGLWLAASWSRVGEGLWGMDRGVPGVLGASDGVWEGPSGVTDGGVSARGVSGLLYEVLSHSSSGWRMYFSICGSHSSSLMLICLVIMMMMKGRND